MSPLASQQNLRDENAHNYSNNRNLFAGNIFRKSAVLGFRVVWRAGIALRRWLWRIGVGYQRGLRLRRFVFRGRSGRLLPSICWAGLLPSGPRIRGKQADPLIWLYPSWAGFQLHLLLGNLSQHLAVPLTWPTTAHSADRPITDAVVA